VGRHRIFYAYVEFEDHGEVVRALWVAGISLLAPPQFRMPIGPYEIAILICGVVAPLGAAYALYRLFH